jgi:DNA-binding transcriptional LysR family regulator
MIKFCYFYSIQLCKEAPVENTISLDTKQLRHLSTVVREGTFMRAAEALNVSQPAISKSILLLERAVGAKLLERGRHGAEPTIFGQALALRYNRIEAELQQAARDIAELKEVNQGHLTIGATRTASSYIVPVAVSALKALKPNIHIEIIEDRADRLIAALKDARFDLVVGPIYGEFVEPNLEEEFLFNSQLVVVTRAGHPLGKRRSVNLSDLKRYAYVGVRGGSTLSRQVELLLKTAGISGFRYSVATNSADAAKGMIERSDCFGLLPKSHVAAELRAQLLHVTKLNAAGNTWPLGVRWRRDRAANPGMSAFIAELRSASKRLSRDPLR